MRGKYAKKKSSLWTRFKRDLKRLGHELGWVLKRYRPAERFMRSVADRAVHHGADD